jgi:hypothetical protein
LHLIVYTYKVCHYFQSLSVANTLKTLLTHENNKKPHFLHWENELYTQTTIQNLFLNLWCGFHRPRSWEPLSDCPVQLHLVFMCPIKTLYFVLKDVTIFLCQGCNITRLLKRMAHYTVLLWTWTVYVNTFYYLRLLFVYVIQVTCYNFEERKSCMEFLYEFSFYVFMPYFCCYASDKGRCQNT